MTHDPANRYEYRAVWKREGIGRRTRRAAKIYTALKTLQQAEHKQAELPRLEYAYIERRIIGEWERMSDDYARPGEAGGVA